MNTKHEGNLGFSRRRFVRDRLNARECAKVGNEATYRIYRPSKP